MQYAERSLIFESGGFDFDSRAHFCPEDIPIPFNSNKNYSDNELFQNAGGI